MKKLILLPYTAVLLVFTLGSCSVDKRVYRNGYHIEWNSAKNDVKQKANGQDNTASVAQEPGKAAAPATKEESNVADEAQTQMATASAEEKPVVVEKKKSLISRIIKEDTQEEIAKIQSGSKAAAFKSGFKTGLKMMMPDAEAHTLHLAIASFILGILSLFAYYGSFVLGLLAIIFGAISIHRIRKGEGTYKGNTFAWIGLICGIIGIVIATVIIRMY